MIETAEVTGAGATGRPVSEFFAPSAARGQAVDRRMHDELAVSLAHLAEASTPADASLGERLADLAAAIRGGRRVPPLAFRTYFKLVQELVAEDLGAAAASVAAIEALGERTPTRRLTWFGTPDGDRPSLELIGDGMRIAPITEAEAKAFGALLDEGFDLMRQGLPELYGELSAIVHEVLLARAPQGDKMEFDGASHYQFWGLLMLNPKHHKTPLAVVEVLAHEASHSLLFGLTIEEPLVFNPDDELFPSPLRIDPRPMDGIYHATYVSARMCWAMENLAETGLLSVTDAEHAREAARKDRENWEKGLSVVDAHGRLSATGARVLDSARAWMSAR